MVEEKHPYDKAGWISRLFLRWAPPLFERDKEVNDRSKSLPPLMEQSNPMQHYDRLKKAWKNESEKEQPSFSKAFGTAFRKEHALNCIYQVPQMIAQLGMAYGVYSMVWFHQNGDIGDWEGYLNFGILALSIIIHALALVHFYFNGRIRAGYCKQAIILLIYNKIMKTSSILVSQKQGQISNSVAVDLEFLEFLPLKAYLYCVPPYFVLASGLLLWILGPAAAVGVSITLIYVPIALYLNKLIENYKNRLSGHTVKRLSLIQKFLEGIKQIKIYSWELAYEAFIETYRAQEISLQKRKGLIRVINSAIFNCGVGITVVLTFYVHILLGNELSANQVFSVIILIFSLHYYFCGMFQLSLELSAMINAGFKRIEDLLNMPKREKIYSRECKGDNAIEINNLTAMIGISKCLDNVSMHIKKGELVIVQGTIGSGKSSLLLALLGELNITEGEILKSGSVGYLNQNPWIFSNTLRENILLGKEFDQQFYDKTIEACCLRRDLNLLDDEDNTMLSDRGANLSGGQRVRISLARVIYSRSDIYLLDDPLCAVDTKVSNHLFGLCINGLIKDKTRIIVSNNANYTQYADVVITMKDGRISNFERNPDPKPFIEKEEPLTSSELESKPVIFEPEKYSEVSSIQTFKCFCKNSFGPFSAIFVIILCIISQGMFVALNFYIGVWASQDEEDQDDMIYILILLPLAVGYLLIGYFRNATFQTRFLEACKIIHNLALKAISQTQINFFDLNSMGAILARFSKDTFMIDEILTFYLFDFIQQSLTLLTIVVIISIFNPFSVPVVVLVLIYEFWFISKIMPENIKGIKYELSTKSPLYSLIISAAEGVATISSLNGKRKFTDDLYAAIERNLRAYNHQVSYIYYLSLYADFGTCVYAISNALFIWILSFYFTDLAAGIALSMIILAATNISWFLKVWSFTAISLENAQRLIDYSNLPKEGQEHQDKDLDIQTGRIDFLDVSLKYPNSNNYALNHLTYTIEPGTKVGIIGRTGAGKSSIFAALLRLSEISEGGIFIDRQDISKHSIKSLRQGISCIPQNSLIFPTSLRNNLDPLNKCHDDQILSALKDVQLLKYFEDIFESRQDRLKESLKSEKDRSKKKRIQAKLKQSVLDMKATSKFISLSVGQLQLLSLVRVILRDNRILLMDEATSSLDTATDMFVQQMIRTKFKSCTVITIAHRLETIQDYDLILVVDAGRVAEYDTPTNLLQNPQSHYSKLLQASKRAENAA